MVPQEVNVTEQEKAYEMKKLETQISGAVGFLVMLRRTARENGAMDVYPMFEDSTISNMLDRYEALSALRGY
jgi:hypothetical protein